MYNLLYTTGNLSEGKRAFTYGVPLILISDAELNQQVKVQFMNTQDQEREFGGVFFLLFYSYINLCNGF